MFIFNRPVKSIFSFSVFWKFVPNYRTSKRTICPENMNNGELIGFGKVGCSALKCPMCHIRVGPFSSANGQFKMHSEQRLIKQTEGNPDCVQMSG